MPFRVSGRNLDIGEALRNRMNARVAEAMAKYFDGGYSGHVTVGKEGFGFRTECAVHLDSGITLHTDGMAADAYASADQAALRIEKRLLESARRQLLTTAPCFHPHHCRLVAESGDVLERWERRINHRRSNFFDDADDPDFRCAVAKLDRDFAADL